VYGALRNLGYIINKKKVQRIIQKLLRLSLEKVENIIHIKEKLEKQLRIKLKDDSIPIFHIKKSLQIQLNLNIMK